MLRKREQLNGMAGTCGVALLETSPQDTHQRMKRYGQGAIGSIGTQGRTNSGRS